MLYSELLIRNVAVLRIYCKVYVKFLTMWHNDKPNYGNKLSLSSCK